MDYFLSHEATGAEEEPNRIEVGTKNCGQKPVLMSNFFLMDGKILQLSHIKTYVSDQKQTIKSNP